MSNSKDNHSDHHDYIKAETDLDDISFVKSDNDKQNLQKLISEGNILDIASEIVKNDILRPIVKDTLADKVQRQFNELSGLSNHSRFHSCSMDSLKNQEFFPDGFSELKSIFFFIFIFIISI